MAERPVGSPTWAVKSPRISTAVWPRSWNWRSLRSTTAKPRWMSDAVGSMPSLIRSGRSPGQLLPQVGLGDEVGGPGPDDPDGFVYIRVRVPRRMISSFSHGRKPYLHASSITALRSGKELNDPMLRRSWLVVALALAGSGCAYRVDIAAPEAQAETTKVFAADGSLITTLHAEQDREEVGLEEMAGVLKTAVVAIEDSRFFAHKGVDLRALARAMRRNAAAGRGDGGRVDDHAAVREERAARLEEDRQPEGAGGGPGRPAGANPHEGSDPRGVPQPHLLRQRRVRRAGRHLAVLRQAGVGGQPGRGGPAGRPDPGAGELRPLHRAGRRAGPPPGGAGPHAGAGLGTRSRHRCCRGARRSGWWPRSRATPATPPATSWSGSSGSSSTTSGSAPPRPTGAGSSSRRGCASAPPSTCGSSRPPRRR